MKKTFHIKGMHCNSCAQLIEEEIKDKVNSISVSYSKEQAEIDFDPEKISDQEIINKIKEKGYDAYIKEETDNKENSNAIPNQIQTPNPQPSMPIKNKKSLSDNIGWIVLIGSTILLLILLYHFVLSGLNIQVPEIGEKTSLILLFFAGILTGFHCIGMCGAFVVGYTTKNAIKGHKSFKQHLVYGGSKLLSYSLIGGIFGLIGGVIAFSVGLRGIIAILAGSFMIFYALSMFGFKFFKRFQFNPKFLTKATYNASKHAKGPYKAPFITGILGGLFIACGPLQAMYLYAMGTGNFLTGSLSLAAFGLGTLPVMIGFGSVATVISHKATKRILKISAILVLVLGIIMLNRGLTVLGSPITYDGVKEKIINPTTGNVVLSNGFQEINMEVTANRWSPDSFILQKGIPVKWNINVKELTGCNKEIIVNEYELDIKLKKGMQTIEFTPDKVGTVRWSCWMGMIPGSFIITESGQATQEQIATATPQESGSCGGSCGSSTCGAATGGSCGCGG